MSRNLREKIMSITIRLTNTHQKRKSQYLINIIFALPFFSNSLHGILKNGAKDSQNLIIHNEALVAGGAA
jgi:hypothetical protein